MATTKNPVGVLLRGEKGKLHFIPNAALRKFALKAGHQRTVESARHKGKALEGLGVATSDNVSQANLLRRR